MRMRSVAMACALTLTVATGAMAQSDVPAPAMQDGIVAQVDTAAGVVTLRDGRMYQMEPGTALVSKGYPTPLSSLTDGDYITISGAKPVIYRDGQYVERVEN